MQQLEEADKGQQKGCNHQQSYDPQGHKPSRD